MEHTVLIIGGGAAGLAAAVSASRAGAKALLMERLDRVGKKILATGNGRCNVMNAGPLNYPGGEAFARQALTHFPPESLKGFFSSLGVPLREEEAGRVYPASGQASSVLDGLRLALSGEAVQIVTGAEVFQLEKSGGIFTAHTSAGAFQARRAIVCGGGRAAPKLGSNGSCYPILARLGHPSSPARPALSPLKTDPAPIRGLAGVRVKGAATLKRRGKAIARQAGEFLFTEYGVSGVAAMQLARYAQEGDTVLHLDFSPALALPAGEVPGWLFNRREQMAFRTLEQFFLGAFHPRVGLALIKAAGLAPLSRQAGGLKEEEVRLMARLIQDFPLAVTGVKGFDAAQVTWGGADPFLFDPATMESLRVPGLYAAGEVLDVDGDCGGFNLMFAFASGALAGASAGGRPYRADSSARRYV